MPTDPPPSAPAPAAPPPDGPQPKVSLAEAGLLGRVKQHWLEALVVLSVVVIVVCNLGGQGEAPSHSADPFAAVNPDAAARQAAPSPVAPVDMGARSKKIDGLVADARDAAGKREWMRCFDLLRALAELDAGTLDEVRPILQVCSQGQAQEFNARQH